MTWKGSEVRSLYRPPVPSFRGAQSASPESIAAGPSNTALRCPTSIVETMDSGLLAPLGPEMTAQYTARPPEMSNTAPVENEHSSEASHATIAAISSTVTKRFIGIFDSI